MKRHLVPILLFLAAGAAARAQSPVATVVVTWNATSIPTACAPTGTAANSPLGRLRLCPVNTSFQVLSFSLGSSRAYPGTNPANVSDVSLAKGIDPSSSALFQAMLQAQSLGNVLISVYSSADLAAAGTTAAPIPAYSLLLTGALVTSIQDDAGGASPVQYLSLSYATIKYSYVVHNSSGTQDSLAFTYNRLTNKVS